MYLRAKKSNVEDRLEQLYQQSRCHRDIYLIIIIISAQ